MWQYVLLQENTRATRVNVRNLRKGRHLAGHRVSLKHDTLAVMEHKCAKLCATSYTR